MDLRAFALVFFLPALALAQAEPPTPVPPIPAWSPSGSGFEARVSALNAHEKKHNPDNDARVHRSIVEITARTGKRGWLKRGAWTDEKVQFSVGSVSNVRKVSDAVDAAEAAAYQALKPCESDASKRLLDWYVNGDGKTFALVGCWAKIERKKND